MFTQRHSQFIALQSWIYKVLVQLETDNLSRIDNYNSRPRFILRTFGVVFFGRVQYEYKHKTQSWKNEL